MDYQDRIDSVAEVLKDRAQTLTSPADIMKSPELRALYAEIPTLAPEQRGAFGRAINALKQELEQLIADNQAQAEALPPIDITAPFDVNTQPEKRPRLLLAEQGTQHPLMRERQQTLDIFYRMGFMAEESRELDDEYHMFTSLNFPAGHPARDDYDTFMTEETDTNGQRLVAPAHTSTMQNRMLHKYKDNLEQDKPIAVIIPDRVFRNEDLDARHEHAFYQIEGIYVDKGVTTGHLIATLKAWLKGYFGKEVAVKIQPFYFPFTEPSFEFAAGCVFCDQQGCNVCSYSGWIELGGCGMIHPNVLKMGGVDPEVYSGFAWGFGIDRLVMLKYNIEDVRHFQSGKLDFLRQFK